MTDSATASDSSSNRTEQEATTETDIAIVGMAGRFPGAPDADSLWERVASGDDCLVDLDRDRLIAAGLPAAIVDDDHYVARTGLLDGVDRFDPAFFGIGARDAAVMDPQHRIFLECVWEAIESAALVPERFDGAIGVFAGCGMNTYLINNLITNPRLIDQMGWFLLRHTSNDKDFLPTFVSYKLDLRGPSISVQTACSTSLVAMHLAAQSLLSFECDMAVAGGSTIEVPHGVGYTFQEGEILSPDGRCRAFDATSNGTVLTSGAGAVVMRRLADALDDGDPVLAVMKASAVNNDGARKVSYLAPSVDGHADVIKEALALSGLSARDIGLIDAHGTGTPVGDPIEFAALTEAFRDSTDDVGFCRLTSTKPNIGHLDTAAGVASVIKVIQALRHRTLPPLANFVEPSPLLDLTASPFSLSGEAVPWPDGTPRRAGVSSLGVGGTNAHVILEEASAAPLTGPGPAEQMLALSGHTAQAVDDMAERLAAHLDCHPEIELADVAHTLAIGRRAFAHRRIVTIDDRAEAAAELRGLSRRRRASGEAPETPPRLAFMFPGGGSQYAGMGQDLDDRFDVFHETLRDGMERVLAAGGPDLVRTMPLDADEAELQRADVSLPSVFVTSVALARQWMAWGAIPDALIGHSLGEYVAAHLSGVLSLDDAITLVVTRSRLMAEASGGRPVGMLVISMSADDCTAILPPELSLSVVNSDADCVVAGPLDAVEEFAERLRHDEVDSSLLALSAAAHSAVLDPILDEFRAVVSTVSLSAPTIPYLSNLSGDWITADQATDPQYWVDHLRGTVRFDRCLNTLLAEGPTVLAELGPGHSLSSTARHHDPSPVAAIAALRHPNDSTPDTAHSLQAFASLWVHGIDVDLDRFTGDNRRRLRLPTYPFQRERHWIEPGDGARPESFVRGVVDAVAAPPIERIADVRDWFWQPEWATAPDPSSAAADRSWTIIGEPGDRLAEAIRDEFVERGDACVVQCFPIEANTIDSAAVCFVGPDHPDQTDLDAASDRWLDQTLDVIRHLGGSAYPATTFAAVTRGAISVREPAQRPVDALVFGPVLVAPREYPDLDTVVVDVGTIDEPDASAIVDELIHPAGDVRALRGGERLSANMVRRPVDAPDESAAPFVRGGTYVITGGLGDIGSEFAMHLATTYGARLALVSSTDVPDEDQWARWTARHGSAHPMSQRIAKLQRLRSVKADFIVVRADTGDPAAMREALDEVEQHFEKIDGAIHAAGHLDDALIELMSKNAHRGVVRPKAGGAAVLVDELRDRGAGLLVLVSSTSSFLAAQGQASYVAANSYLDALAGAEAGGLRIVTMNSGAWRGVGMAADASRRSRLGIVRGDAIDHPVMSERVTHADGSVDLIGQLSTSRDWIVAGHRTGDGTALLPGTGHLDLALTAMREIGEVQATLRDLLIIEALVVPDDAEVVVKVSIGSGDGQQRTITISSDLGSGHEWHLHAQAVVDADPLSEPPLRDHHRTEDDGDMTSVEAHATQRSLELGPRWNAIVTAASSTTRARADLELAAEFRLDLDAWSAHPALADVAVGIGVTLRAVTNDSLLAPVAIESARSTAPLPAGASVDVQRVSASDGNLVVDIDISDPQAGSDALPALMLRGVTLRDLGDGSVLSGHNTSRGGFRRRPPAGVFVELAEGAGIDRLDAATVLDRVLSSGLDRIVVSSVDLADLVPPEIPNAEEEVGTSDVEPGAGLEATLIAMWTDLLGVRVGPDDDFFDCGGHSLIAIRLIARLRRELDVKLDLSVLFEAPTVAELAVLVRAKRPDIDDVFGKLEGPGGSQTSPSPTRPPPLADAESTQPPNSLVHFSSSGSGTPLTIVHGAGGSVFFLSSLAREMKTERPLSALQAAGIRAGDRPDDTIEEMAQRYVDDLVAQSDGPHLLGGFSGGGIVALEMSRRLQSIGHDVRGVVLFDSVPAGAIQLPAWTSRKNVLVNLLRNGWGPTSGYVKSRVQSRAARMLSIPFGRVDGLPVSIEDDEDGVVDLSDHFARVSVDYPMPMFHVNAILVKADLMWPYQPHDYHWSPNIDGTLTTITAPGDHETMFAYPNVETVWERLSPLLDRHDV